MLVSCFKIHLRLNRIISLLLPEVIISVRLPAPIFPRPQLICCAVLNLRFWMYNRTPRLSFSCDVGRARVGTSFGFRHCFNASVYISILRWAYPPPLLRSHLGCRTRGPLLTWALQRPSLRDLLCEQSRGRVISHGSLTATVIHTVTSHVSVTQD